MRIFVRIPKSATRSGCDVGGKAGSIARGSESKVARPPCSSAMNKQTAPDQIRTAIHTLAAEGIKTTTYWVIGHPGETEADFEASLRLIEACGADIYEAEPHGFYFYPRGQVASKKWSREGEVVDLYGPEFADLLVTRSFQLKTAPSRADLLRRVARFTALTRDLGIANPYSLREIEAADHRWIAGHARAGPPLIELHNVNHPPASRSDARGAGAAHSCSRRTDDSRLGRRALWWLSQHDRSPQRVVRQLRRPRAGRSLHSIQGARRAGLLRRDGRVWLDPGRAPRKLWALRRRSTRPP